MGPTGENLSALYLAHHASLRRSVDALLQSQQLDALVVHAGRPRLRTRFDDQYWPLRPVPHFQHWLPLVEADATLVLRPGQRPRLLRVVERNFWEHSAPLAYDFWRASFDEESFADLAALKAALPPGAAVVAEDDSEALRLGFSVANPVAVVKALDQLRTQKSAYEIACLSEANRIAALGHRAVSSAFLGDQPGAYSELDLHLLFLGATSQDDPETPYKNIVALNEHAATLHHIAYARRPTHRAAESLLLDAGATFLGYASDITRTHVRGHVGAFGDLVAGVDALQQRLCAAASVGRPYESLHDEAHLEIGRLLVAMGLLRTTVDEAVTTGLTRAFLPHGLGHSLGLQCHDVGCAEMSPRADNPFLRNTALIAVGQTFTIEPGVYFVDMLLAPLREGPNAGRIDWRLCDELRTLGGVRIEDDLHVVETGPAENLTRKVLSES